MTGNDQQVALVVGASRGIGRQVAIDLAKNGYTGMSAKAVDEKGVADDNLMGSGGSSQIHERCVCEALPSRSQLAAIDHQHRGAGDPGGWRAGNCYCG